MLLSDGTSCGGKQLIQHKEIGCNVPLPTFFLQHAELVAGGLTAQEAVRRGVEGRDALAAAPVPPVLATVAGKEITAQLVS